MIIGPGSTFGGQFDIELVKHPMGTVVDLHFSEGLTLFEHHEADKRPDLFVPRSERLLGCGTFKRLRDDALYFAYRFDGCTRENRELFQKIKWPISNPANGKTVICNLVDWGPGFSTGRVLDISPEAAERLGLPRDFSESIIQGEAA